MKMFWEKKQRNTCSALIANSSSFRKTVYTKSGWWPKTTWCSSISPRKCMASQMTACGRLKVFYTPRPYSCMHCWMSGTCSICYMQQEFRNVSGTSRWFDSCAQTKTLFFNQEIYQVDASTVCGAHLLCQSQGRMDVTVTHPVTLRIPAANSDT